jgi:SAM-dependent methyltransferase
MSQGRDHEHGHGGGHGHGHGGSVGGGHGAGDEGQVKRDGFGNPEDLARYLAKLDAPDRACWQKPDEVVAAMRLSPGDVVADVGAGAGYFALRLAQVVGPTGRVHALDVEPRLAAVLVDRAREAGLANVHSVVSRDEQPLPPEPCRAILLVNAFHHFPDGAGALRALADRLAPDGRIVLVEFHEGELPLGPPPDHKVTRARILSDVAAAGLEVEREETFLPYQHYLVLRRRAAGST